MEFSFLYFPAFLFPKNYKSLRWNMWPVFNECIAIHPRGKLVNFNEISKLGWFFFQHISHSTWNNYKKSIFGSVSCYSSAFKINGKSLKKCCPQNIHIKQPKRLKLIQNMNTNASITMVAAMLKTHRITLTLWKWGKKIRVFINKGLPKNCHLQSGYYPKRP